MRQIADSFVVAVGWQNLYAWLLTKNYSGYKIARLSIRNQHETGVLIVKASSVAPATGGIGFVNGEGKDFGTVDLSQMWFNPLAIINMDITVSGR